VAKGRASVLAGPWMPGAWAHPQMGMQHIGPL
jgi:hypothetical protein